MLRRFLKGAGIKYTLGLTATPLKLQTNMGQDGRPFSKLVMLTSRSKKGIFFKKIIYVAQIQEMVESKFWSKLEYQSYDFNTGDLIYNTTGAEYSNSSIKKAYKNQKISGKIVKKVEELYDRRSILIAVPSIDEAKALTTLIPSCKAVYSDMPSQERKETLEEFKSGKLRCVAQVNILSVGFDYPELDCIITGRPTASLSWWYQFVGRVTRIHPNKSEGLVIDFVGAVPKFGKVEDIYFKEEGLLWKMYGENKRLLTGIPIQEIGLHIEGEKSPHEKAAEGIKVIMPFGKFARREVREIPASYREWMLINFKWTPFNQKIKDEILRLKSIGI
jgi:DNA repair protein RadD